LALPGLSKDRRRRAFVTTLTELIANAAAARTGLRSTPKNGKLCRPGSRAPSPPLTP